MSLQPHVLSMRPFLGMSSSNLGLVTTASDRGLHRNLHAHSALLYGLDHLQALILTQISRLVGMERATVASACSTFNSETGRH